MSVTIEDACFSPGAKIRIERGAGELAFHRCSFEGCEIFIGEEVDATIFTQCVFRGATFRGRPLSPRIASECQCGGADIEMAATVPAAPATRFRR